MCVFSPPLRSSTQRVCDQTTFCSHHCAATVGDENFSECGPHYRVVSGVDAYTKPVPFFLPRSLVSFLLPLLLRLSETRVLERETGEAPVRLPAAHTPFLSFPRACLSPFCRKARTRRRWLTNTAWQTQCSAILEWDTYSSFPCRDSRVLHSARTA